MDKRRATFIQYGLSSEFADKLISAGLTATKVKTLSMADLTNRYGLKFEEAQEAASSIKRAPIDDDIVNTLLQRNNFTCCLCKGVKGKAFIIHHIKEYASSQDNSYDNLVVLCPVDHDIAHRRGGLTLSITPDQLRMCKFDWESQVERANAAKAAQSIELDSDGIDYINIRRIEDLCIKLLGCIPETPFAFGLRTLGFLNQESRFDKKFVSEHLSGGSYLFDFPNASEALHYRSLLRSISQSVDFHNLAEHLSSSDALRKLEGKYAFFISGVYAKQPDLPITAASPPITMHYTKRNVKVEWILDPNYIISMSAIGRLGKKTRFLIYSLVRSVEVEADQSILVGASPLLIGQPSLDYDRTPAVAYMKRD